MSSLRRIGRVTEAFARLGLRRPFSVLLGAVLVTVAGAWGGYQLQIDPDLKALLPPDYPSVARLEELQRRVGNQSDFIVEISSPDREANIKFGHVLARRMETLPELRYVIFHRDLSFFKKNALLYLPLPDLLKLRRRVIDRIKKEVVGQVVVDLEDDEDEEPPKGAASSADAEDPFELDTDKWIDRTFSGAERPSEYMEAEQGRVVVIKARPVEQTTNMEFSVRLVEQVQRLIKTLNPQKYHPKMAVKARSNYAQKADESEGFRADLFSAVAFAVALLLAVIGLYFRTLRSIPIVLLPVIIATVATLGLGTAIFGVFNVVSIFIFAILLGLGIDFGIHCLSRYHFERRRGLDTEMALRISLSSTGSALFAGALTTVAVFFLLMLGKFRGFSQFGALAGMGVILALLATFFLVPALVTWTERLRSFTPPRAHPRGRIAPDLDYQGAGRSRRSGIILAVAIVLISFGLGLWALLHLGDIPFEYDFNKLERPPAPLPVAASGSGPAPASPPVLKMPAYKEAVGVVTTGPPAVAFCDTAAQCEEVSWMMRSILLLNDVEMARLRKQSLAGAPIEQKRSSGPAYESDDDQPLDEFARLEARYEQSRFLPGEQRRLLSLGLDRLEEMRTYLQAFLSLQLFIPRHQQTKLRIIQDIRARVDRKRGSLSQMTGQKVDRWYHYLEVKEPVQERQLPRWVLQQLGQQDGKVGRFVVIWNGGLKADYITAARLYRAFFDLPVAKGTVPVAANCYVLVEVINTLKRDGPVVLAAATLAVLICLIISFRSLRAAALVLVPLVVSITWLAGLHLLLGWKVNMFSIVAFPLLVGLGIDDGIHIYHRWAEEHSLRVVLREVGGPITLTAVTTFIGFAGLLMTDHVGIRSLGLTAAVGIALALVGSIVTLPALLYTVHALGRRSSKGGLHGAD